MGATTVSEEGEAVKASEHDGRDEQTRSLRATTFQCKRLGLELVAQVGLRFRGESLAALWYCDRLAKTGAIAGESCDPRGIRRESPAKRDLRRIAPPRRAVARMAYERPRQPLRDRLRPSRPDRDRHRRRSDADRALRREPPGRQRPPPYTRAPLPIPWSDGFTGQFGRSRFPRTLSPRL
jgi:hypothetical protein